MMGRLKDLNAAVRCLRAAGENEHAARRAIEHRWRRHPRVRQAVLDLLPEALRRLRASRVRELPEKIDHPAHYGGDTTYEAIKVIEAWSLGFCLGNCVKYVARAGKKPDANAAEDLKKARWYLEREIDRLEKEQT